MSLNFGSPSTTTTGGSFSFGSTTPAFGTPQQQNASLTFSTPQQQQQQQQTGLGGFGTTSQSFGAAPNQQTAAAPVAFGTSAAQPPPFGANTTLNAGAQPSFGAAASLGFGGTTPAFGANTAPTFGTAQTAAPLFGMAPTAPAFGATHQPPAFGATQAVPSFGSFGTTTSVAAPTIGLPTFGATAITTSTMGLPMFGTLPSTSIATGIAKPITSIQPLSLSAATTTATAVPLFGQSTATVQPTINLGLGGLAAAATNAAAAATSTAVAAPVSFNFSATPASGGLSFGTPVTSSAPVTSLGLQGFTVPATSTTAAVPTLGMFGSKPTVATASSIPSLFGSTPATSVGSSSLFGTTTSLVPAITSLSGATQPVAQTPSKIGLGGVDSNAAQPKTVEGGGSESGRVKEQLLPQEIIASVEVLKMHIKQQKQFSSDIARTSTHKLFNVSSELQTLNWALTEVSNCVEANFATIKLLRDDTAMAIRQAEMAQRTHEIQPGLQFENNVPLQFFMELVQKYEADMITFRNQVEMTEKHMRSLANPQSFTADDLKNGLKQIHESFVALAGRVHETHQKVEAQKEQYLKLRKHLLKDKTNVFADEQSADKVVTMANISCGPTPFSATFGINLGVSSGLNPAVQPSSSAQQQQQLPHNSGIGSGGFGLLGQHPTLGGASNALSFGFGSGVAANNTFGGNSTFASDGTFNLQKPPVGSKRNKQ